MKKIFQNYLFFSLNLKGVMKEDEYKEELRRKWEEVDHANVGKDDIHYTDIRFDGEIYVITIII